MSVQSPCRFSDRKVTARRGRDEAERAARSAEFESKPAALETQVLEAVDAVRERSAVVLDLFERAIVLALYGWLVARIFGRFETTADLASLLLLPSEGLVVVFMAIRRPTERVSRSPRDWAIAVGATCAPMLVARGGAALISPALAATVLMFGMIVQVHAKLALGRRFGCVPAHRGLQLGGPYRFVRHPMYAGYLLGHAAYLAINPTAWNLVAYALCYALQIPRLLSEERLLAGDPSYQSYCALVRWRLLPGLF
jgi:protein-S-isoprenylcysteine O-methyltransferase Ste14